MANIMTDHILKCPFLSKTILGKLSYKYVYECLRLNNMGSGNGEAPSSNKRYPR